MTIKYPSFGSFIVEREHVGRLAPFFGQTNPKLMAAEDEIVFCDTADQFEIIESYFKDDYLAKIVRHQIESYNDFTNRQMNSTVAMFNPTTVHYDNHFDKRVGKYSLEVVINFENVSLNRPQIHENNGSVTTMFPHDARLRNFTYTAPMIFDLNIKYVVRTGTDLENVEIITVVFNKIQFGKLPIMVKSSNCILSQYEHLNPRLIGECAFDTGGYFIINGSEKVILVQETTSNNRPNCYKGASKSRGKSSAKKNNAAAAPTVTINESNNGDKMWSITIRSVPDVKCISPKQSTFLISQKNNGFGHPILVSTPRFKKPVPIFIIFRAFGIISDLDICKHILLNVHDEKNKQLLQGLTASIIDANNCITRESAINYISSEITVSNKKTDELKSREDIILDIIYTDICPHVRSTTELVYYIGYLINVLLKHSYGMIPEDDRDTYDKKRGETAGVLLNNLFRNYFNTMVKDMERQIIKEIKNGSWQSSEDYKNIINTTNIFKIIKSSTIETGFKRALSTGDFGIKNISASNSKAGVAQVLNRLNYMAFVSHLRRIAKQLDRGGNKLIKPRKLTPSSWGAVCPMETPEGQSVGIVKTLSILTHITIQTNVDSLYAYILPQILILKNVADPSDISAMTKVFINGTWCGVTQSPRELFRDIKTKKCSGVLNMYTSVVFNCDHNEIWVNSDSGRYTRPLLIVRDGKLLITAKNVESLKRGELTWDDLCTNQTLPEAVIEYIDMEEQSFSLIAMFEADLHDNPSRIEYTHCEIHPSTILGIMGSCIPFPDHNQSPRNAYQCLDADETVLMADGTRVAIRDVKVGDEVVTFHPETLEMSITAVTYHYVRKTDKRIYRLKTLTGRSIIATEDHKFMTCVGWMRVDEMLAIINAYDRNEWIDTLYMSGNFETNRDYDVFIGIRLNNNNVIFDRVDSILSVSNDRDISDITVMSDNHSFIAGSGFLSSNCAQGKQAIGTPVTNINDRMDTTSYELIYPSKPLVATRIMKILNLDKLAAGANVTVAIMTHTGFNQEDSILINKGSIDRGMFQSIVRFTEKDEDKHKTNGDEEIRGKPNPLVTKGVKFADYSKIGSDNGTVPKDTLVMGDTVIIGKYGPIKEKNRDQHSTQTFIDHSKILHTTEETYIDRNVVERNGDGYAICKTRTRTLRSTNIGDKFSCYDDQTEILTTRGWIKFELLTTDDWVATLFDDKVVYQQPTQVFAYDYKGKMYKIESNQIDLVVTPNHMMYVKSTGTKSKYTLRNGEDIFGKALHYKKNADGGDVVNASEPRPAILGEIGKNEFILPACGDDPDKDESSDNESSNDDEELTKKTQKKSKYFKSKVLNLDAFLEFFGIWIAEGYETVNSVRFAANKPRVKEALDRTCEIMGLTLCKNQDKKTDTDFHSYRVNSKQLAEYFKPFSVGAINKYLPSWVWHLTHAQCRILLHGMCLGDGHQMKGTSTIRYDTSSIKLANDFQRLCLHAGWSTNIGLKSLAGNVSTIKKAGREGETITSTVDAYRMSIITAQNEPKVNKNKTKGDQHDLWTEEYNGKVYCCEVAQKNLAHGLLYVRRNGIPAWSSNSRHGQKGTCGNIIPQEDMPYFEDGSMPDIIINPHAIPSRMTVGHLKETLLSLLLCLIGYAGDGTAYGDLTIDNIGKVLSEYGMHPTGNQVMYSGLTGEQIVANVFSGPIFYQRLKHMVADKEQARPNGVKAKLTRQPNSGRARAGGLRFGEMERDCTAANGMAAFTADRLFYNSDPYSVWICKDCGSISPYNLKLKIAKCLQCGNLIGFDRIKLPYATKLLSQELEVMNIAMKFITA